MKMEKKYFMLKHLSGSISKIDSLESLLNHCAHNVSLVKSKDGLEVYAGHIDGEENFSTFLNNLNALGICFYTRRSRKCQSSIPLFVSDRKDSDINIPFMGSPFKVIKTMYMMCCQDGNYNPKSSDELFLLDSAKKRRVSNNPTKKIGCPAYMIVKSIVVFEDDTYKVDLPCKPRAAKKLKVLEKLNRDLLSSSPPIGIFRYILLISREADHIHPVVTSHSNHPLHPKLQQEIYNLVNQNICSVTKVKTHLQEVVFQMFEGQNYPKPDVLNRSFYPTDKVIQYHIHQAILKMSKDDDPESLPNSRIGVQRFRKVLHKSISLNERKNSQNKIEINQIQNSVKKSFKTTLERNTPKKRVLEESRELLINMIGYTYLENNEEKSLKFLKVLKQLEREMKLSAECNIAEEGAGHNTSNVTAEMSNIWGIEHAESIEEDTEYGEDSDGGDYYIVEITDNPKMNIQDELLPD